jgi:hypothetical protein
MDRLKALTYRERIILEAQRQHATVSTLPENTLLLMTFRGYSSDERKWVDTKIAVFTTNVWNFTSIQCHMVACDTHTWEWDHDMQVQRATEENGEALDPAFGRHALKFQYMKTWEPLDSKMIPLLVGYPIKYPRFYTLLTKETYDCNPLKGA